MKPHLNVKAAQKVEPEQSGSLDGELHDDGLEASDVDTADLHPTQVDEAHPSLRLRTGASDHIGADGHP